MTEKQQSKRADDGSASFFSIDFGAIPRYTNSFNKENHSVTEIRLVDSDVIDDDGKNYNDKKRMKHNNNIKKTYCNKRTK